MNTCERTQAGIESMAQTGQPPQHTSAELPFGGTHAQRQQDFAQANAAVPQIAKQAAWVAKQKLAGALLDETISPLSKGKELSETPASDVQGYSAEHYGHVI